MLKDDRYPSRVASRRRIRTHAEWKVETHIRSATGPTSRATRWRISSAALLVKVMARISNGEIPCSAISQAIRWVRTLVLPDPAPATTSKGPPGWVTASACTGLRPASSADAALEPVGAGEAVEAAEAVEVTLATVPDATDSDADASRPVGRTTLPKARWGDQSALGGCRPPAVDY